MRLNKKIPPAKTLVAALLPLIVFTASAQTPHRTSVDGGAISLDGRPFPMVLDAGTDSFTPQDYDTIMASHDAFGANTWWLQYSMKHMRSPQEGDFSGLERALDSFARTGMRVNLYLRAEYRDLPAWFYEKNRDYRMLDPSGKPVGTQICLQHPGFRRLIDAYVRKAVRAARAKPSLLMYSIYDEFCIRGWGCFCPRCVRKYREYLKAKYRNLGALNAAWSSAYGSWSQIDAPRTQSFDPNYGDWQHYRLKVLHDFGKLYYDAVREEDPGHLVWIDINMDLFDYTWQRLCIWWKLTGIFDAMNFGPDGYADDASIRTAMNRAIRDNYHKAVTWHLGISPNEYVYRPDLYSLLFESSHGGLVWWYDFWKVLRTGKVWGAGDQAETALRANWFAARELNFLARYLDDLYVHSRPIRGEVAAFVSGLTDMMRSVTDKLELDREMPTNLDGLAQILRDLNVPYEAIGEDQLQALDSFKVILLGQFSMCAEEATVRAFREYVRQGGTLIVTNYAFSADANGRQLTNPAFGLAEMWGSSGSAGDEERDGTVATNDGLKLPSLGGVARRTLGAAEVLGRLAGGTPAITWNRFGKGQVFFIGTNAGEVYSTGYALSRGKFRSRPRARLDLARYRELTRRFDGWRNWATVIQGMLERAGVRPAVEVRAPAVPNLLGQVRVSLQEQQWPPDSRRNHLIVVALEPVYDPIAQINSSPGRPAKAQARTVKNLTIRAMVPSPEQVRAVYKIPPIGYQMGRMDAVPERVRFRAANGALEITLPEVTEAVCLLAARDARPLVGVRSAISTVEGKPSRVLVTVDNAAGVEISGEIGFPPAFRLNALGPARFQALKPGERYSAEFDVTAPAPIERNRTFQATVRYRRADGRSGEARSYPVSSRTDERIAWYWLQRVEQQMTEAATTPGTPHNDLYRRALQQRELVYAAYNSGAYADVIRLAREHGRIVATLMAP